MCLPNASKPTAPLSGTPVNADTASSMPSFTCATRSCAWVCNIPPRPLAASVLSSASSLGSRSSYWMMPPSAWPAGVTSLSSTRNWPLPLRLTEPSSQRPAMPTGGMLPDQQSATQIVPPTLAPSSPIRSTYACTDGPCVASSGVTCLVPLPGWLSALTADVQSDPIVNFAPSVGMPPPVPS